MSTLSTGQRQKMNMARGLLNDPWILFLDEPTLGLDVAAARSIRELVLDWKGAVAGRTVLLTTHYMAEADELCERIAIVDHGRILAIGTPDELKKRVQRESIFRLELDSLDAGIPALARLPGRRLGGARRRTSTRSSSASPSTSSSRRTRRWAAWSRALAGIGSHILALRKSEPTLEDVFVELVGRGFGDDGQRRRRRSDGRRARAGREAARRDDEPTASRTCRPAQRRRGRGGLPRGGAPMTAGTAPGRPAGEPRASIFASSGTAPTRGWRRCGRDARSPRTTPARSSAARSRASAAWSASRRGCSSRSCCRS